MRTEDTLWMGMDNPIQQGPLQHLTAKNIRKVIGEKKFNEYYKFAIVRNPYSKMVSEYFYFKRKKRLQHYLAADESIDFETFLRLCQTKPETHWMKQKDFVYDEGRLIVDHVGKFENFVNEYRTLLQRYGLWDGTVFCLNVNRATIGKHYTEYYSDKTKQMVEEMYREDLEAFDYDYDRQACFA